MREKRRNWSDSAQSRSRQRGGLDLPVSSLFHKGPLLLATTVVAVCFATSTVAVALSPLTYGVPLDLIAVGGKVFMSFFPMVVPEAKAAFNFGIVLLSSFI